MSWRCWARHSPPSGQPWTEWRARVLDDVVELALRMARQTARDGEQRAFEYHAGSLEELQDLRVEVRDRLQRTSGPDAAGVTPWLWNAHTTDGAPLTRAGLELGYSCASPGLAGSSAGSDRLGPDPLANHPADCGWSRRVEPSSQHMRTTSVFPNA